MKKYKLYYSCQLLFYQLPVQIVSSIWNQVAVYLPIRYIRQQTILM